MAHDSNGLSEFVSRRKFIATTGATSIAAIAGCSSGSSDSGSDGSSGGSEDTEAPATEMDATEMDATEEGGSSDTSALESGGSSTVYPIANTAASYWNANRPASDSEYWPHGEYDIDTDQNLADYWGGLYGFEAGGEDGPPFQFTVGLSHSGTGVEKVMNGQNDIGNSSGNVEDELPDRDSYDQFIDHVVGVDGQPLVVSQEIADAGVEQITGDQLKSLYKGELTNWSELGGPDREIQVTPASPTVTARTSASHRLSHRPTTLSATSRWRLSTRTAWPPSGWSGKGRPTAIRTTRTASTQRHTPSRVTFTCTRGKAPRRKRPRSST